MTSLSLALANALPEVILAVGAILMLLIGAFRGKADDGPMSEIAVGLLAAAALAILLGGKDGGVVFNGAYINDRFGDFMKLLSLAG